MAAIGQHYSSTAGKTVQGHDIVLTHYLLLGRSCPQQPALYRQQQNISAIENGNRQQVQNSKVHANHHHQ